MTKTRAEAVVDVWTAILTRYPSATRLAEADREELETALRPLGLWAKKAVQLLQLGNCLAENGLDILRSRESALHVPGLGSYASAAIACFLYEERIGIVDGNVRRVLTRVFGVKHPKTQRGNVRRIAALADTIAAASRVPRETNYGLLDLAAAICKPKPRCGVCPIRHHCKFAGAD